MDRATSTWRAMVTGLPLSMASSSAISWALASSRSARRSSRRSRSTGRMRDHSPASKAWRAAATARSMSAAVAGRHAAEHLAAGRVDHRQGFTAHRLHPLRPRSSCGWGRRPGRPRYPLPSSMPWQFLHGLCLLFVRSCSGGKTGHARPKPGLQVSAIRADCRRWDRGFCGSRDQVSPGSPRSTPERASGGGPGQGHGVLDPAQAGAPGGASAVPSSFSRPSA